MAISEDVRKMAEARDMIFLPFCCLLIYVVIKRVYLDIKLQHAFKNTPDFFVLCDSLILLRALPLTPGTWMSLMKIKDFLTGTFFVTFRGSFGGCTRMATGPVRVGLWEVA